MSLSTLTKITLHKTVVGLQIVLKQLMHKHSKLFDSVTVYRNGMIILSSACTHDCTCIYMSYHLDVILLADASTKRPMTSNNGDDVYGHHYHCQRL